MAKDPSHPKVHGALGPTAAATTTGARDIKVVNRNERNGAPMLMAASVPRPK